jgi:hypothetical protein
VKKGGEFCDHAGEQGVLGGMDFEGKCFEGIVGGARDLGLAEVGAAIDFRRDPMDRAPACRDASVKVWAQKASCSGENFVLKGPGSRKVAGTPYLGPSASIGAVGRSQ